MPNLQHYVEVEVVTHCHIVQTQLEPKFPKDLFDLKPEKIRGGELVLNEYMQYINTQVTEQFLRIFRAPSSSPPTLQHL